MSDAFPIMRHHRGRGLRSIPMSVIAPDERQALANHDQTLDVLAQRGGLDSSEAVAVLEGRRWRKMSALEADARLLELVSARLEAAR